MNLKRAILFGALIWLLVFVEWSILVFAPYVKESINLQWTIHFILLIPIVGYATHSYYKKKSKDHGLVVGLIMLLAALVLDAIISVPLFILPQGMTYAMFFLNPLMLAGMLEFLLISYAYYRFKVL